MVRAALWAVIACGVAPACGNKGDAPAAQPGAVAGKVLEVAGSVKVGAKQLAVGDRVNTDDVIETGADGNVVIELAHNQARWELGPGHKVRPTESLAWAQERHGAAARVDHDTSAAGRPAERSAADTSTSAKTGAPPPPSAPAPAPPAESAAAAVPAAAAPPRTRAAVAAPEIQPPPKPQADVAGGDAAPGGSIGAASGGASAGNLTADTFATLSTCVPAGGHVQVKIHVANHVPTITFQGDADAAVRKCITSEAKKLSIAVSSGDLSLTLRR